MSKMASVASPERRKDTFEQLLEDKVGPFGPWQITMFVCFAVLQIFQAMTNIVNVFFAVQRAHYCQMPELENAQWFSHDLYFGKNDALRNLSYPSNPAQSGCYRYDRNYSAIAQSESPEAALQMYSDPSINSSLVKCSKWVFDNYSDTMQTTIQSQYDLVCDKAFARAHSDFIYVAGIFVGSLVTGPLSDNLGRLPTFIFAGVLTTAAAVGLTLSPTYEVFLAMRFFLGFNTVATWLAGFVLAQEITTAKFRNYMGAIYFLPYGIGITALVGLAYLIRDWQKLVLVSSLPLLLYIPCYWLCSESPRWLLVRMHIRKAKAVLDRATKWNNVDPIPIETLEKIAHVLKEEEDAIQSQKIQMWHLFRYPIFTYRVLNIFYIWFANSLLYYGLLWSVASFDGNLFVNGAISSAIEIPSYFACIPLVMFGRMRSQSLMLLIAGVAILVVSPIPDHLYNLKLVFFLIGRFAMTASFAIVYVFTSELFPTVVRTTVMATSSMVSRVGAMLVPYIIAIPFTAEPGSEARKKLEKLPLIIFGIVGVTAGLLTVLLPETKGRQLPEQLQDALDNKSFYERNVIDKCHPDSRSEKEAIMKRDTNNSTKYT